jgi:hypothetical protein
MLCALAVVPVIKRKAAGVSVRECLDEPMRPGRTSDGAVCRELSGQVFLPGLFDDRRLP